MCLAVPGKIISFEGEPLLRMARIDYGGIIKKASLAFLPDAEVEDYVLVHAGVAISKIDEEAALKTYAYLEEIGEIEELKDADT